MTLFHVLRTAALRSRNLHADERGLLMPLVLFFSLAFTTSVTLVINTGEVTSRRIHGQNAVDAAAASGGATLARGMNYIAQNNITMAKVVASSAILDALESALQDARIQGAFMLEVGYRLSNSPEASTRAVGIHIVTHLTQVEFPKLDRLERRLKIVRRVWTAKRIWRTLRLLSRVGDALFAVAPPTAQHAAQEVYRRNLGSMQAGEVWMFPLYPRVPACRGVWGDLAEKTTYYAVKRWRPHVLAWGWDLFYSGFNYHFSSRLQQELDELFLGAATGGRVFEPRADRVRGLERKIQRLQDEIGQRADDVSALQADHAALVDEHERATLEDVSALEQEIRVVQDRIDRLEGEIAERKERIEAHEKKMKKTLRKMGDAVDAGPAPTSPVASAQDLHPGIHPYLIRKDRFPASFTFFAVGSREAEKPMVPIWFNRPDKQGDVYTLAAVRLYNPTRADLWTPNWRVKLVRIREDDLRNQLREPPTTCAAQPRAPEGEDAVRSSGAAMPPARVRRWVESGRLFRDDVIRH